MSADDDYKGKDIDFNKLLSIIDDNSSRWIYRGQSKSTHRLEPAFFRKENEGTIDP